MVQKQKNFAQVPRQYAYDLDAGTIDFEEFGILCLLFLKASFYTGTTKCIYADISRRSGLSVDQVGRTIRRLADKKYIAKALQQGKRLGVEVALVGYPVVKAKNTTSPQELMQSFGGSMGEQAQNNVKAEQRLKEQRDGLSERLKFPP